jgi:hypothetical protein
MMMISYPGNTAGSRRKSVTSDTLAAPMARGLNNRREDSDGGSNTRTQSHAFAARAKTGSNAVALKRRRLRRARQRRAGLLQRPAAIPSASPPLPIARLKPVPYPPAMVFPCGFVEPCLPSKVARPPSGPLWSTRSSMMATG